eukprot:s897_g11.t1
MGKVRFKSLAERLEDVDVNVTRHLEFVPEEGDDEPSSTHFVELAKSWSQRNRTEDFVSCLHELRPHTQSLPMIVCNLGTIVDILFAHVSKPKTMASEPILMLLGVLAKDTCMELLPHFERIFAVLVQLIAAAGRVGEQDADLLEHVFQCLAYLLKYLARYVVSDLSKYLAQYAVLLKHGRPHIRHFAGETLAFILRRVKLSGLEAAYDEIFKLTEGLPAEELLHMADGLSVLLFESVKGVQHNFRSQTPDVLETVFEGLAKSRFSGPPRAAQLTAVRVSVLRMRSFARSLDGAAAVVEAFFRHFGAAARRYAKLAGKKPGTASEAKELGEEELEAQKSSVEQVLFHVDLLVSWLYTKPRPHCENSESWQAFAEVAVENLAILLEAGNLPVAVAEGARTCFPPEPIPVSEVVKRAFVLLWRAMPAVVAPLCDERLSRLLAGPEQPEGQVAQLSAGEDEALSFAALVLLPDRLAGFEETPLAASLRSALFAGVAVGDEKER